MPLLKAETPIFLVGPFFYMNSYGAAEEIRTLDLSLTKGVLYP